MHYQETNETATIRDIDTLKMTSNQGEIGSSQAYDLNSYNPNKHLNKRHPSHRIFVNRSINLKDIRFYGFDLDHTLAVYKMETFGLLTYKLACEKLIAMKYPKEIQDYEYDPFYAVRGLWIDKKYGNLLKVDAFGNIIRCVHGFKELTNDEIEHYYPNKFVQHDGKRMKEQFAVLDTLYELPESFIVACIVHCFCTSPHYRIKDDTAFEDEKGNTMTYAKITEDVRNTINNLYADYVIQKYVDADVGKYIVRDENLGLLLRRMRQSKAKTFLITNGVYPYSSNLLKFLFGEKWRDLFDYVIVEAKKPGFFGEGKPLQEYDVATNTKGDVIHSGPLLPNKIYAGGNSQKFSEFIGAKGKDVLYVGDHMYGDIVKSKKQQAWHTFLIIPELYHELNMWSEKQYLYQEIEQLNDKLDKILIDYDSSSVVCPDTSEIEKQIVEKHKELDRCYSFMGSAFRNGATPTHFGTQILRYADIYSSKCVNLLYYPFFYLFKTPLVLMPHECTVDPHVPFEKHEMEIYLNRKDSQEILGNNRSIFAPSDALSKYVSDHQKVVDRNNNSKS